MRSGLRRTTILLSVFLQLFGFSPSVFAAAPAIRTAPMVVYQPGNSRFIRIEKLQNGRTVFLSCDRGSSAVIFNCNFVGSHSGYSDQQLGQRAEEARHDAMISNVIYFGGLAVSAFVGFRVGRISSDPGGAAPVLRGTWAAYGQFAYRNQNALAGAYIGGTSASFYLRFVNNGAVRQFARNINERVAVIRTNAIGDSINTLSVFLMGIE